MDNTEKLESFIRDWYYDERSHQFARQAGQFLLRFVDDLEASGLARQTVRKHRSNCWLIGKFECDYGYHDTFSPKIFLRGPSHLIEFKRKVSRSNYAINNYKTTWRKLDRYVRSLEEEQ